MSNHLTGAGSGFGAAIAERFAAEGAKVVVSDLNEDTASATVKKIGRDDAVVMKMDVTSESQWQEAVKICMDKWGRLDIGGLMFFVPPRGCSRAHTPRSHQQRRHKLQEQGRKVLQNV